MNRTSVDFDVDSTDRLVISVYSELEVKTENLSIFLEMRYHEGIVWDYIGEARVLSDVVFFEQYGGRYYSVGAYYSYISVSSSDSDGVTTYAIDLTNESIAVFEYLHSQNSSLTTHDVGFKGRLSLIMMLDAGVGGRLNERYLSFAFSCTGDIEGNITLTIPMEGQSIDAQWNSEKMIRLGLNVVREPIQSTAGQGTTGNVLAYWVMPSIQDNPVYASLMLPLQGAILALALNSAVRRRHDIGRLLYDRLRRLREKLMRK